MIARPASQLTPPRLVVRHATCLVAKKHETVVSVCEKSAQDGVREAGTRQTSYQPHGLRAIVPTPASLRDVESLPELRALGRRQANPRLPRLPAGSLAMLFTTARRTTAHSRRCAGTGKVTAPPARKRIPRRNPRKISLPSKLWSSEMVSSALAQTVPERNREMHVTAARSVFVHVVEIRQSTRNA